MKPRNRRIFEESFSTSNSQVREKDKNHRENGSRQILDSDDLKNIEEAFKFPDEKKLREEALIRWRDRELRDTMKDSKNYIFKQNYILVDLTLRINKLNEEIVLIEDKTEFEMLYERLESEKSEGRFQATILKFKIWRI